MADQPRRKSGVVWLWLFPALLIAYPLSVGPMAWLVSKTGWEWLAVIYAPLDWLGNEWTLAAAILEWYLSFWVSV